MKKYEVFIEICGAKPTIHHKDLPSVVFLMIMVLNVHIL